MIRYPNVFFEDDKINISIEGISSLKGFDIPRQKQSVLLYKDGVMNELTWSNLMVLDEKRYITVNCNGLVSEEPIPAALLPSALRSTCISRLLELGQALAIADSRYKFVPWDFSSLSLTSFYFIPSGGVMILPRQVTDMMESLQSEDFRYEDKELWYAHNCVQDYGKVHFLTQLLYYALTGVVPYQSYEVRNNGFKPVPIRLFIANPTPDTDRLCRVIDGILTASKKVMYAAGNPYDYFEKNIRCFERLLNPDDIKTGETDSYKSFMAKYEKSAKKKEYFRKKGWLVILLSIVGIVVIYIAAFYIKQALTPPETRGMEPAQIVVAYYDALNDLDTEGLEDSLKRGVKSPDLYEVASLYVTSSMRKSYERINNAVISAQEWVDGGKQGIPRSSTIYGTTNMKTEYLPVAEGIKVRATFTFYSTSNYDEDPRAKAEKDYVEPNPDTDPTVKVYEYLEVMDFGFEPKKDWFEISSITSVSQKLTNIYEVPYLETETNSSNSFLINSGF